MINREKIEIRLKAFDHRIVEHAVREILMSVKRTGASVLSHVMLPKSIKRFIVNRSPHVDKKSREQYEIRSHKRLLIISDLTSQTVDALGKVDLPSGVDVEIKVVGA